MRLARRLATTPIPATRPAPELCQPQQSKCEASGITYFADQTTKEVLLGSLPAKKEAERRQTCFLTSASCDAARIRNGRARLSAFHHGSDRRGSRPFGATPGQVSWDAAGRPALYGRPNRGAQASRSSTGVTRARLSQSRESTSRTGRSAGQHDARSCPGADCIGPRAGTALAPPSGVPSAEGVLHRARFYGDICT